MNFGIFLDFFVYRILNEYLEVMKMIRDISKMVKISQVFGYS